MRSIKNIYGLVLCVFILNVFTFTVFATNTTNDENQPKSASLNISNIVVINNVGANDIVQVQNLQEGDIVSVYDALAGGKQIGQIGPAHKGESSLGMLADLGDVAGDVYLSITNNGKTESDRIEVPFSAPSSEQSAALKSTDIKTYFGYPGYEGLLSVDNLNGGDIIKAYDKAEGGNFLGGAWLPVTLEKGSEPLSIEHMPENDTVYVSVIRKGQAESNRIEVKLTPIVTKLDVNPGIVSVSDNFSQTFDISVNGVGQFIDGLNKDNVTLGGDFTGLTVESISRDTLSNHAIIKLTGKLTKAAGTGTITVDAAGWDGKLRGENNSISANVEVSNNPKSASLNISNIIVINNVGANDIVQVQNLQEGDIVSVYDALTDGKQIGQIGPAHKGESSLGMLTDLGDTEGDVYLSITSSGSPESDRIKVPFSAPSSVQSTALKSTDIKTYFGNTGYEGLLSVDNLNGGDIIKAYDKAEGGNFLGGAWLPVTLEKGSEPLSIEHMPENDTVYVSVIRKGQAESSRIEVKFTPIVTTLRATPKTVSSSNSFDKTFIVSINGVGDLAEGLSKDNVTLGGDFSGLTIKSITRDAKNTWEAAINLAGSLVKNTGTGTITIDAAGWIGQGENHPISASVSIDAVTSVVYNVYNDESIIRGVKIGTSLNDFMASIAYPEGTTAKMFKNDGVTAATDLDSGYKLVVTDPNGKILKSYTISLNVPYGDVNGDGKVDASDYKVLQKQILKAQGSKKDYQLKAADLNGDNRVNSVDLLILKKYLFKKITKLPKGLDRFDTL